MDNVWNITDAPYHFHSNYTARKYAGAMEYLWTLHSHRSPKQ